MVGFQVTLVKADNTKAKAYAVWNTNQKNDFPGGSAKLTSNQKEIYIAANIAKIPVPGDYLVQGVDQWSIIEVEAYKPTNVVLAYRCVVQ